MGTRGAASQVWLTPPSPDRRSLSQPLLFLPPWVATRRTSRNDVVRKRGLLRSNPASLPVATRAGALTSATPALALLARLGLLTSSTLARATGCRESRTAPETLLQTRGATARTATPPRVPAPPEARVRRLVDAATLKIETTAVFEDRRGTTVLGMATRAECRVDPENSPRRRATDAARLLRCRVAAVLRAPGPQRLWCGGGHAPVQRTPVPRSDGPSPPPLVRAM